MMAEEVVVELEVVAERQVVEVVLFVVLLVALNKQVTFLNTDLLLIGFCTLQHPQVVELVVVDQETAVEQLELVEMVAVLFILKF